MKRAILLYNPKAGNRQIIDHLDYITERLQKVGYELRLYRSEYRGAIEQYIINNITESNTDIILISGGDGTINEGVNGILKKAINIPIAILPLGTANDFAHTVNIDSDIKYALDVIEENNIVKVDIGKANNRYFINVCNMGLFTGISHVTDLDLKKNFGKLAYYVKGIEEIHGYESIGLEIETREKKWKEDYMLVLVFNGKGAGGFDRLTKNASIVDGKFEVVGIKNVEVYEIPKLFFKILQGEHIGDPNIEYFTTDKVSFKCMNTEKVFPVDLDGEPGTEFPLQIEVMQSAVDVYLPAKEREQESKRNLIRR